MRIPNTRSNYNEHCTVNWVVTDNAHSKYSHERVVGLCVSLCRVLVPLCLAPVVLPPAPGLHALPELLGFNCLVCVTIKLAHTEGIYVDAGCNSLGQLEEIDGSIGGG